MLRRYAMNSVPPRCWKPRSSTESTRRPRLHLRADRVQRDVERLLGDREVGDAHRHDALLAPDEERQRRLERQHLEHARAGERVVRLQVVGARVDERLERRELRVDAELDRVRVRLGIVELVGRVDLGLELDRLDRGALQPQRLRAVAAALAAAPAPAACA